MVRWADIAITKKLYFVIGTMAVLLCAELATLRFAMHTLSAVRAFVGGEGSWSKAQKNAAIALQRYALTHDERDYQAFLAFLSVPEGDHRARLALLKPDPDLSAAREGFLAGNIDPDDVDPMISILRRFSNVSYMARAIAVWTEGDRLLAEFKTAAEQYHDLVRAGDPSAPRTEATLRRIEALNAQLTSVENQFSDALGEGSRWMDRVLITLLVFAVLAVESVGLSLTFLTARRLSRGLATVRDAAGRIGRGEFRHRIESPSGDEVGQVGESLNRMGALLERSYADLERRVNERTAELRAMAEENARLYERASAAVRMRDEFFSIASHELKTPLSGLYLRLQMLARALEKAPTAERDAKIGEITRVSLRQAEQVAALSSQLMDITRIRLGKLELNRERCDLAGIVREILEEQRDDAARSGSEIRAELDGAVQGTWDALRIGQVVRNLVSNAIKYGGGRPIAIELRSDPGRGVARLAVRDQGRGIALEDQARIFERFARAGDDEHIPGLGLGLYVSRQIVRAHGGTLTVESRPGEGAVFVLELEID